MSAEDDFAQLLAHAARSVAAVFLEFSMAYYGGDSGDTFVFFEGMDDKKYYLPAIQGWRDLRHIHPFICDGKAGVLEMLRIAAAREEFEQCRLLFFVDKDHDDYLGKEQVFAFQRHGWNSRLFTTECYSVENYLVTEEAVRVMWMHFTPYGKNDTRLNEVLKAFGAAQISFARAMRPLMAACVYMRMQGIKLNLGNVRLAHCIEVRESVRIRRKKRALQVFEAASGAPGGGIRPLELREVVKRLRYEDSKSWLRGKYELWFLAQFLRMLFRNLEKGRKERKEGRRVLAPRALEGEDLVELLANRLPYPEPVAKFLTVSLCK